MNWLLSITVACAGRVRGFTIPDAADQALPAMHSASTTNSMMRAAFMGTLPESPIEIFKAQNPSRRPNRTVRGKLNSDWFCSASA
jgi:hypothetical protein